MYAVGKFGGLISRGAVDIIVVQQQDGSFKSSPWYVRFGKFQGVRKSGEKVVNISVNGVEAGFHMYLDSNGEAYFLRNTDPDGEEGEFIVSAASSGDEREAALVQEAQLRKSKSTSCDSSTMEDDVRDGKILMRTTSRRTTILERMFVRKTVKNNAHALDRVSSLERAEIAAELLDTKWSTNLPRNLKPHRSNDEPSKSKLAESRNNDQMETSKNVLPEYSLDHGNEMDSNCNGADYKFCIPLGGRNSLADLTDQSLQTTLVKEEVVEIHTHETSDFTDRTTLTVRQPGSESLLNNLGTDKSIHESVDTQGELLHKSEDVAGREMHIREAFSNSIFEIHTIKTDTTSGKSEVVSQFVTVDSDGANQILAGANSPTYATTVSTGKHEVTLAPPIQYPVQEKVVILSISETLEISQDAVQDKMVILSSSETMESSYVVSDISDHKVQDEEDSRVSNGSKEQLTSEEKSLAPSKEKDMVKVAVEEHEAFILEDPTPPILVDDGPDMDISVDNVSLSHTGVAHDLSYQHDVVCLDASSSVVETSSYVPDNDPEGPTEKLIVENKACNRELDVSVTQTSTIGDVPTDCIAQSANFPNKIEFEGSSTVTGSSSLVNAEVHNIKTEDGINRFSYVSGDEVGFVREATAETEEEAEAIVPFSEYAEEIQFLFSDTENFADTKAMDDIVAVKTAGDREHDSSVNGDGVGFVREATAEPEEEAEVVASLSEYAEEIQFQFSDTENFSDRKAMGNIVTEKTAGEGNLDESDCDTEKQEGGDVDIANDLESCSDSLRPVTSPVSIPTSDFQSGDNIIEAKSLPNRRSHIHDLERSDRFELSHSLQSNAENNGFDPVKSMNSSFLEDKSEITGDSEENSSPPELTSNVVPDYKHADNLKIDSFVPFSELSLCRHLLFEGMGEDAACSAFDSEKITLEKFHTMKPSLTRNKKLVVRIAGRYFPWDAAVPIVLGLISFSEEQVFEPKGMIKVERVEPSAAPGGSWRIWPFGIRRTRTIIAVQEVCESTVETSVSTPVNESNRERNKSSSKRIERKVRSLTPTSEELASLDLREGRNVVTFTFSTAIVGKQQVDCHIYLWKWNTRIVISDVDGTITKSDVFGQFMPMVGVDWSQNGVAHLFSAIKENGYQLLFLSARAISQAHITRRFLFNLKQNGKALPDGPVVISPDGILPSLYREVIRRAPHEFKISCLEAIKDCFPPDSNPFYAGFGNRDTDELSYLKVGIPMGKIFIINPKGEVAVNRRVDRKSYTSLHDLVHGMFPPISSSSEREDYNTWNYWKMPLPDVDM